MTTAELKAAMLGNRMAEKLDGSFAKLPRGETAPPPAPATPGKRVRQEIKPKPMNKLEAEWFAIISHEFPNFPRPRAHAKRFRLANGVQYTPDFSVSIWPQPMGPPRETAWEVKGPKAWDDAIVKIKVAATNWPEVRWLMVWKEGGEWKQQELLP